MPNIQDNMSYADIHFHILPGVDDGPSIDGRERRARGGSRRRRHPVVVATPHVRTGFLTDVSDLPDRVRELRNGSRARGSGSRFAAAPSSATTWSGG